ncbi:hypothetical protein EVAR_59207_1 [Eumeta japonica]|uniref:Uncharacterized protein n=1 Tax=Eumeta variegata TaxID=151549 RepID=A0A4C1YWL7_EUMVA|nr:hypothetical protein EVAR_59207_1 [Eumeta japonica]
MYGKAFKHFRWVIEHASLQKITSFAGLSSRNRISDRGKWGMKSRVDPSKGQWGDGEWSRPPELSLTGRNNEKKDVPRELVWCESFNKSFKDKRSPQEAFGPSVSAGLTPASLKRSMSYCDRWEKQQKTDLIRITGERANLISETPRRDFHKRVNQDLKNTLEANAPPYSTVARRCTEFECGRTSTKDDSCSVRPTTALS